MNQKMLWSLRAVLVVWLAAAAAAVAEYNVDRDPVFAAVEDDIIYADGHIPMTAALNSGSNALTNVTQVYSPAVNSNSVDLVNGMLKIRDLYIPLSWYDQYLQRIEGPITVRVLDWYNRNLYGTWGGSDFHGGTGQGTLTNFSFSTNCDWTVNENGKDNQTTNWSMVWASTGKFDNLTIDGDDLTFEVMSNAAPSYSAGQFPIGNADTNVYWSEHTIDWYRDGANHTNRFDYASWMGIPTTGVFELSMEMPWIEPRTLTHIYTRAQNSTCTVSIIEFEHDAGWTTYTTNEANIAVGGGALSTSITDASIAASNGIGFKVENFDAACTNIQVGVRFTY